MILTTSERSLEDDMKNLQMDETTAVATKDACLGLSRNLDLTDIVYPSNRDVVSFENASINVDSSTDVIFGPVTQLNVNGNVTIVQNGNDGDVDDGKSEKKQSDIEAKLIESSQALKYWIILTSNKLFRPKDRIFVIIMSGFLVIVIGLVLYPMLSNLLLEKNNIGEEKEYGRILGDHSIFYKNEWHGLQCTRTLKMPHPVGLVIISHTNTKPCYSFANCSLALRRLQKSQMSRGMWDIGYNFAIGGDGNIYVGRGWDYINSHAHLSIGISFIGNYNIDKINKHMTDASKKLLKQGVSLGKLSNDYILIGHNQSCKNFRSSPGNNVYKEISKWEHYSNITLYMILNMTNLLTHYEKRLVCNEIVWSV